MMKPATIVCRVLLRVLVVAAALIGLSTCSNPVGEALNSLSFGLVGTWVNIIGTVSSSPGSCYMLTVNVDGTFQSKGDGGSVSTGTYTVDSVSISGDSRTFQVHYVYNGGTAHDWVLARVTGGTLYESVYNSGAPPYPSAILPGSPSYMKATLQ